MVERWVAQWGDREAGELCRANNETPAVILRTNTLKISRERLASCLDKQGVLTEPTVFSPEGLRVLHLARPLQGLQSFQRGQFSIQDEASQLVSHWLDCSAEHHILDACAAPGGKTGHIAQLLGNNGTVVSVDIHDGRLRLLKAECERLGIYCVKTVRADLEDPVALPNGPYDRILLDAPCSGLGVLRRHPDAKWRRVPEDVARMAKLQRALLTSVAQRLRSGGILLFSVCTHTCEETVGVLAAFLAQVSGFRLLTSTRGLPQAAHPLVDPDGIFRSLPHHHQMDGFTAFRLQRI
jgi:16S rRNA (cytosine967-C5)-methyltransferase